MNGSLLLLFPFTLGDRFFLLFQFLTGSILKSGKNQVNDVNFGSDEEGQRVWILFIHKLHSKYHWLDEPIETSNRFLPPADKIDTNVPFGNQTAPNQCSLSLSGVRMSFLGNIIKQGNSVDFGLKGEGSGKLTKCPTLIPLTRQKIFF